MIPPTEGLALVTSCLVLSSGLGTEVAGDVQQIGGEVITRPAKEESLSADADQGVQATAPSLGLFEERW